MSSLLTELRSVFKDDYVHLGGDEVEYEIQCWSVKCIENSDPISLRELRKIPQLLSFFLGKATQKSKNTSTTIV